MDGAEIRPQPNTRDRTDDLVRLTATPAGFFVYDTARRPLPVLAAEVIIRPGMPPHMNLALAAGNIDVVGKPLFAVVDPATSKPRIVRKIIWADGTETDFPEPEKMRAPGQPDGSEAGATAGAVAEPSIGSELGQHPSAARG